MLFEEDKERSLLPEGFFFAKCEENFLKITTLLDTRNSKNSKRIIFMVPELYWSCPKAYVLYLLPQFNFVTVANRAYYVICPMF